MVIEDMEIKVFELRARRDRILAEDPVGDGRVVDPYYMELESLNADIEKYKDLLSAHYDLGFPSADTQCKWCGSMFHDFFGFRTCKTCGKDM